MAKSKSKKKDHGMLKGVGVSSGISLGRAVVFGRLNQDYPKFWINQGEIKHEVKRFNRAIEALRNQLEQVKIKLCKIQSREPINIIESHIMLLKDDLLINRTHDFIENSHVNAEWAVALAADEMIRTFSRIGNAYFNERKYDLYFFQKGLIKNLTGKSHELFEKVPRDSIIVAHDLSPAEILHLIQFKVLGIVTETGGTNSHAAIVARSLQIPAVLGVHNLCEIVNEKDLLLIDGEEGHVFVKPSDRIRKQYRQLQIHHHAIDKKLKREAKLEAQTSDGVSMNLLANIEFESELPLALDMGARGIGLYRTEFLSLQEEGFLDEEGQYTLYSKILKKMSPQEVTIRTLDLGADKIKSNSGSEEKNPALGFRGIRLSIHESEIFMAQLRALYRASIHGSLKILFPMISSIDELRQIKKIVSNVQSELKEKNLPFNDHVPLGAMIETPAAVVELDLLAKEVDFFSVGSNDLIQYLLAVDRGNERVSYLYHPYHSSIFRVMQRIIRVANQNKKELTLCGEIAGDPLNIVWLIGMGFERLSMSPMAIPKVKKLLRNLRYDQSVDFTQKLLNEVSSKDRLRLLKHKMSELFPEYFG